MQRFFINDEILSLPKPNMVFCVKNDELFVYAYIGNGRPTPETKLFLCPFSNTMSAGKICLGSAKTIQSRESFGNEIAYWKTLYWDSVFESFIGHHVSKKFTLEKFKAAKTFKSEWLVPAKKTVNDLIPK
jgi:PRTRC genetic system protein B